MIIRTGQVEVAILGERVLLTRGALLAQVGP